MYILQITNLNLSKQNSVFCGKRYINDLTQEDKLTGIFFGKAKLIFVYIRNSCENCNFQNEKLLNVKMLSNVYVSFFMLTKIYF